MPQTEVSSEGTEHVSPASSETGSTLYIDGAWTSANAGGTREIRCPSDGSAVAKVAEAERVDAERAIAAARRAFDDGAWANTSAWERGDLLIRVSDILVRDREEFARAESLDTGKRLVESGYDMDDIAACFRYFGKIAGTDASYKGEN